MSIQHAHDKSGQETAALGPVKQWRGIVAELEGEAQLPPEDEEQRRQAYGEFSGGKALDLREAMAGW